MSLYTWLESKVFNSLTKKIIGNVLFLLVPNIIFIGIGFWLYFLTSSLHTTLVAENSEASELLHISNSLYIASAVMLVFTLLAGVLSMLFMRYLFLRPIKQIAEVLRGVKGRNGDISARLPEQTFDEISEMAHSYNEFSDSLKTMIADTRQRSVAVSLSASQLQKVILETKSCAELQEVQAQQVFQASQESSQAIEGIASHTQNITNSNENNLQQIRDAGDEMRHVKECCDFQRIQKTSLKCSIWLRIFLTKLIYLR